MAHHRILPALLILAGLLLLGGLLVLAVQTGGVFSKNGRAVTCNVGVTARLTGPLQIASTSCSAGNSCIVNPVHPLSIGDVTGKVLLLQSGITYDTQPVLQNRFLPSSTYQLGACLPGSASQVRIQVKNQNGGVDDDQLSTIQ